jgi:ketopantoate reductase
VRALVIGAGAVGVVLARFLEATKQNEITLYVRAGRRPTRLKLLDAKSGELHVRERPAAVEAGQRLPPVETAILAVRGDQLDEALAVVAQLPDGTRVATVTAAGFDDVQRVRARFPGRAVAQIIPQFLAYPDGDAIRWWVPPLARTLITWESDDAARPLAEELAGDLTKNGLKTRAVATVAGNRDALVAAGTPMLVGFELAGWDLDALNRDRELRKLASRAMCEAVQAVPGGGVAALLLRLSPRPLLSLMMGAAGSLASDDVQAMWKIHGPKIAAQTHQTLDELVRRADERGRPSDGLKELRRRLH